ncbi:MAG TPA: hypothetical protein VGB77_14360 [Abditibacteriaceae bacterium]|jgi:hypothetical protein
MLTISEEQEKNWEFAKELSRAARADSHSPYAGKYIGIQSQQVLAIADTAEELQAALQAQGRDLEAVMVIQASVDHEQTYHLWKCY